MNPSSLFLLGLLQLAQASNATDNTTDTTTTTPAADGGNPAVAIIVVIVVLLVLGGAAYFFVFMPGAMYASLWTNLMNRGSSSEIAPATTGAKPGNTLPMVALRVSGDDEL
jgi:flagellar basal body-associated protein FliL